MVFSLKIQQRFGVYTKMKIEDLRQAIKKDTPIEYTAHCQKRMIERDISREDLRNCIMVGEIIEDYPLDEGNNSENSFPCCLISGFKTDGDRIHIVVGYKGFKILMISACYPDKERWNEDFTKRRK